MSSELLVACLNNWWCFIFIILRMQRRKGQFAGRASLERESPAPGFDPGLQGSGLDFLSRESKFVLYFIN